jgi:Dyp-type peroxidase family
VPLTEPLDWRNTNDQDRALLDNLQANVLTGHVREHFAAWFLSFADAAEARAFLSALAEIVKSAHSALWERAAFHAGLGGGTPYVGVALSKAGYDALGAAAPGGTAFSAGMRARNGGGPFPPDLADPPVEDWESGYRPEAHAVVLLGDATADGLDRAEDAVRHLLPASGSVAVLHREEGCGIANNDGVGIEHFGYVDGRSQPLFLSEEVDAEPKVHWDPAFPLDQLLVAEDGDLATSTHCGSFLVFRKLEQNVRLFQQEEERLAGDLALADDDADRAGATLVGRFRDGTPLVESEEALKPGRAVTNDFTYDGDPDGSRCPAFAHIRKTNPRGSGGAEPPEGERSHIMARRGITYGTRWDDPNADLPASARPTGGVGLLFMAFMSSIEDQFEFTQRIWANNPGFPLPPAPQPVGLDPVIGQGPRADALQCPVRWGDATSTTAADPVAQAVTLKGGEYFFAPSIPFLRSL